MPRSLRLASLTLPFLALACADPVGAPLTAPVAVMESRDHGTPQNFQTHLNGDEEVPARETLAQGNSRFQLSRDGQTMSYKIIASNIENAFMVHIHLAPRGANGGIVVWLRPVDRIPQPATMQGRHDGIFAEGTFTSADFVGALAGKSMQDLVDAIREERAYVNVHTRNLALPAGQLEPGNYPGGEVRGQIDHGNGM